MKREDEARNTMEWQQELPTMDGLYDYRGTLYSVDSEKTLDCNPSCQVNIRKGDGPRVSIYGGDGHQYDVARTKDGMWRGPVGPVHIPVEDARRPREESSSGEVT